MRQSIFNGSELNEQTLAGTRPDCPVAKKCAEELHDYRTHLQALQWFRAQHPAIEGNYDGNHPRNIAVEALSREVDRLAGALDRAYHAELDRCEASMQADDDAKKASRRERRERKASFIHRT